jgi:hypothetical protein
MSAQSYLSSRTAPPMEQRTPFPLAVGMCSFCFRVIWTNVEAGGERQRLLRASTQVRGACEPCGRASAAGKDPRRKKGSPAERVPAELGEPLDQEWKERGACAGAPPELFEPDPLDDDDPADPRLTKTERRIRTQLIELTRSKVAFEFCEFCPVLEQCRAVADAQGYEGIWGGRFYGERYWTALLGDEEGQTGYTLHGAELKRRAETRRKSEQRIRKNREQHAAAAAQQAADSEDEGAAA